MSHVSAIKRSRNLYTGVSSKRSSEVKASTLNAHNLALNRLFNNSFAHEFMIKTHVPTLINKGMDS